MAAPRRPVGSDDPIVESRPSSDQGLLGEASSSGGMVRRVARMGVVSWSVIGVLILAYIIYRFALYPVRIVFAPLLLAMAVVYLLNPVVSALQARGMKRIWGTLVVYLLFLSVVGVLLRFLVPIVADQVGGFVRSLPTLLERTKGWLEDVSAQFKLNIDSDQLIGQLAPQASGGEFISRIFSFTAATVHVVIVLVLGAVLGFYLLVDLPKIQRGAMALIPAGRHREVRSILDRMGQALGGFFRGQLLVAMFVGLASMLGLFVVGLPYWALVGMIAGLFNLIPLIGPFIGAIPALFIAFTTSSSEGLLHLDPGWPLAIGASVALLLVQQIDNHIISPNVVARTVRLHPVTVMLGLLVGGTLYGLLGMLLAVPVIAAIKILLLHYWDTKMQWPPKSSEESPGAQTGGRRSAEPRPKSSRAADERTTDSDTAEPSEDAARETRRLSPAP